MPNRILRDWTDSLTVNELTAEEERFFVRLITKADDYGRFHADPRLLIAALFPLLTDICPSSVRHMTVKCQSLGLIELYKCEKGREYLQIVNFKQRMRTPKSKFPEPADICPSNDRQMTVICPLEAEAETKTEAESYSEAESRKETRDENSSISHLDDSGIPTKAEVTDYADMHGIPRDSAIKFWQHHEINNFWIRNHQLIKWRIKLKQWAESDRQKNREKQGKRKLHPSIVQ